jgi:hypothetical protein
MPQPKRLAQIHAHLRRIAQSPNSAKVAGEIMCAPKRWFPRQDWQIPLTGEQFNPRLNQRQLTLSYQLLPLKRRKAAQNATGDAIKSA